MIPAGSPSPHSIQSFKGFSMRVLPLLLSLVGICFAASDTLRFGTAQGSSSDGIGVLLAFGLNAAAILLSHRNSAGRILANQGIDLEKIAARSAAAVVRILHEPGSDLSEVVAAAAKTAAETAGAQVVEHVRTHFAGAQDHQDGDIPLSDSPHDVHLVSGPPGAS